MGSPMVLLDRALLSSYRLSIVTVLLFVVVWPQFEKLSLPNGIFIQRL